MLIGMAKKPDLWAVAYTKTGSNVMKKMPQIKYHDTPEKAVDAVTAWLTARPHLHEKYRGGQFRLVLISDPYTVVV